MNRKLFSIDGMLSLDLTEEGTVEVVDDTPDHMARFEME